MKREVSEHSRFFILISDTEFFYENVNDAEENVLNLFKFFPQNLINFASFLKHTKENY